MVNGEPAGKELTLTLSMCNNYDIQPVFFLAAYKLIILTIGQGSVFPGNSTWLYGEQADLIATAADGWTFAGWGGDATSITTTTITMDGAKVVVANFVKDRYALTTLTVGQGTVTPGNKTFANGELATLTATPADGWQFSGWSGDAIGTTSITILMDNDKTVTATFTKVTYPVQIVDGNITQPQCTDMNITYYPEYRALLMNFSVTGPSGTYGTCKIAIPKEIIAPYLNERINEVYFLFDGVWYYDYRYSEDATNYYLTFTIHFSTHDICIEFREAEPTPTPTPTDTPAPIATPTTTPTPTTEPTATPTPTASPTAIPTVTPTTTPTNTPAPTTTTQPTTQPSATAQPTANSSLTLPIAGVVVLLVIVLGGLLVKRKTKQ